MRSRKRLKLESVEMISAADITEKCVAIVRFGPVTPGVDGCRPGEYWQVTIDPDRFSMSKQFIRFGTHLGDELMGWQRAAQITVVDVLGAWDGDKPPEIPWQTSGAINV